MRVSRQNLQTRSALWAAFAIFVLGCILVTTTRGSGTSGTAVRVSTASFPIDATTTTTTSTTIAAADSVNAFDVTITFDPALVEASAITLGNGWAVPALVSTIDNVAGSLHVAAFQIGAGCVGGSECGLFSVNWTGTNVGTTALHLASAQLAGSDGGSAGMLTGVVNFDGSLTVTSSPTQTPTAMTTPTTPTATPKVRGNSSGRAAATRTPRHK